MVACICLKNTLKSYGPIVDESFQGLLTVAQRTDGQTLVVGHHHHLGPGIFVKSFFPLHHE